MTYSFSIQLEPLCCTMCPKKYLTNYLIGEIDNHMKVLHLVPKKTFSFTWYIHIFVDIDRHYSKLLQNLDKYSSKSGENTEFNLIWQK